MVYEDKELENIIKNIDSAIGKYELKKGLSVIRGTSSQVLRELGYELDDSIIGKSFSDPAYMSSTISKEIANEFAGDAVGNSGGDKVFMQLDIPAGKGRGAYVNTISEHKNEKEFLIKRAAEFEFYEISKIDNNILLKARWKK